MTVEPCVDSEIWFARIYLVAGVGEELQTRLILIVIACNFGAGHVNYSQGKLGFCGDKRYRTK